MEKIAIIDLGSNTVRLLLVEVKESGHFQIVDQLKDAPRLGEGMERDGFLKPARIQRTIRTLKMFSVSVTRKLKKDGKYFGPFMGGVRCGELLDVISSVYKVRNCTVSIGQKPKKPCLAYHLGRCLAPCAHLCTEEEYGAKLKETLAFLDGNYEEAEALLQEKMIRFAEQEEFELAMEYREKLAMLSKLKLKRITALNRAINADVIALKTNFLYSSVNVLVTRSGIMQGGSNYALEDGSLTETDALTAFIAQFYTNHELPDEIITQDFCEKELLEKYFLERFDKRVEITLPKQGIKYQLLDMAEKNASEYLSKSVDKIKHKNDMTKNACARLHTGRSRGC